MSDTGVTDMHMQIGDWLATTYYYNADGEVSASYSYGRDTSNPNYWNNIWNGIDNGRAEASAQQAIPDEGRRCQGARIQTLRMGPGYRAN